jgi:uncharacterized ion transporter superfamily protein YfcC
MALCKLFPTGSSVMIFAGVIIGLAKAVYLILEQGMAIDPINHALFQPLESLPNQI